MYHENKEIIIWLDRSLLEQVNLDIYRVVNIEFNYKCIIKIRFLQIRNS